MAIVALTDTQACNQFFRGRVLINLQFWLNYVTANTKDVAALECERVAILKAIALAIDLEEAWSFVYKLITAFSPYMERRGYWEMWNWVLTRAIETAQQAGDMAGATTLFALSARLLQWQSRFSEAIAAYQRTIHTARQVGDRFNEARACTNLGYLYIEQGHLHRAEVLCCHALNLFEVLDNDHGRAHTENHLGMLYTRRGLWYRARCHLERACALWQSMGDDHGLMRGSINLGMLYIEMERPEEALNYLEKALHLAARTGEEAEIAKIYANIGSAYRLKGESAKAEAYAWRAEAIFRHFSNWLGLAQVWGNLGLACLDQEKWEEAIYHLKASLEAWRNLNNKYGEIKTLMGMLEYELARGNQQKAAAQLAELEHLISQRNQGVPYHHLQPLLVKYRRSLTRHSAGQAAAV